MATGSNDTRRPPYGKTEYDRPKQAAYSQSAYTQGYPSGGSGRSSYAYAQGGYTAKAPGAQGAQQKTAKKKKPTLKKLIKKLTKRAKPAASVYPEKGSAVNGASAKKPFTFKRFWKKTKRAIVSALRVMARGVYLGTRKLYTFLMGLPPRTLLIGSGAFVAVLAAIIILAVSLPGKDSGENAAQQFAALSASETLDSGFADPVTSVDPATETPSPETSEATEQTVSDAVTTETFTEELKQGDNDPIIAEIQARLMELGYMDSDEPTEHFGPLTQSALKTFQRHNGLDDDGICGQTTYTT